MNIINKNRVGVHYLLHSCLHFFSFICSKTRFAFLGVGVAGRLGAPLPPQTEPLFAPPAPWPEVPRPGLRPRHPSPHPRTPAHPPEAAALALLQGPLVRHASDQGGEEAVRAVGTVAPGLVAPKPGPCSTQRGLRQPPGPAGSLRTGLAAARSARPPRERPRTAGSPPMCQKRMFAPTRPTCPLRWPGQARPAAQLCSTPQS